MIRDNDQGDAPLGVAYVLGDFYFYFFCRIGTHPSRRRHLRTGLLADNLFGQANTGEKS